MKKILLATALLALCGCSMVGPGEKGVRTHFGKVDEDLLNPGLHLWVPAVFGVTRIDIRLQKHEVETNAASKDMQTVVTKFALNWRIKEDQVAAVYSKIGDEDAVLTNVIDPAISEVLKAATSKHNVEEILSKREELKAEIDKTMKERMLIKGIVIEDVNIINITFSHDFAAAIEAKQVAEQRSKQAYYEAQKAEQDATAEVNRAKGQATSQKLLRETLSPELLQLKALEKWNGEFPQVMGSSTLPFINITPNTKKGN